MFGCISMAETIAVVSNWLYKPWSRREWTAVAVGEIERDDSHQLETATVKSVSIILQLRKIDTGISWSKLKDENINLG